MAKSSFYSSTGVTPDNPDVTPVEPNNINAIEDSKNAAAASATQAEASKVAAAQSASDANAAKLAAQAVQADVEDAETNSAASATAAASSAASAATSLAGIGNSETNAATSASNSATSASAAAASALSASSSATSAASDAASAATSLSNIGSAEANAAASATSAASSASSASTDAASASASQVAAAASEAAAATSEANSATSETNAATSASQAATSAANSATSETNAATSASSASTSASNAASSASAASASQVAAAASAASAANAYDTFDDRYLGSKTADPTVDNDGNALVQGSLYFNSTANEMRVYDGGSWIAASSAGGASLLEYKYTATAAQTTFSGADDNANTLNYTQDNLIVTLNGVVLENGADYTATTGTSVVLASGAAASDELNVIAFKSFTTADMVSSANGGTFYNNIDVQGTVTADGLTVDGSATFDDIKLTSVALPASGNPSIALRNTDNNVYIQTGSGNTFNFLDSSQNTMYSVSPTLHSFNISNTERMRIDSSGNLLVGKTASSLNNDGFQAHNTGYIGSTNSGASTAYFNRKTNDGDIVNFQKDGTGVGVIQTKGGDLSIGTSDTGITFADGSDYIGPWSPSGNALRGSSIDIGAGGAKFKDGYFSGTVNAGGVTVDGLLDIEEVAEKVTVTASTSGTINFNLNNQAIIYADQNQLANRTVNIQNGNSIMDAGQSMTCTLLFTNGTTAYYINTVQLDGTTVTPKWSGGSAPSAGNASSVDTYTFTLVKTTSGITVLASLTQYA